MILAALASMGAELLTKKNDDKGRIIECVTLTLITSDEQFFL